MEEGREFHMVGAAMWNEPESEGSLVLDWWLDI